MEKPLKIIVAGEGGQGIQVIGKTLTVGAFMDNKKTTFIPNYGVEQRGGVSLAFVQISKKEIPFPKFAKADILIVLCHRAIERTKRYVTKETLYIYDKEQIFSKDISDVNCRKIGLEGQEYAKKYLSLKVANVIYLGAINEAGKIISQAVLRNALEKELGEKILNDAHLHKLNLKALEVGRVMIGDMAKVKEEVLNV